MRAMEDDQSLLQVSVPRIAFARCRVAQISVAGRGIADGPRPCVVEFAAETLREAPANRCLQRMVGRVIVVSVKLYRAELGIDDDEVLRKSVSSKQASRFARTG